MSDKIYDPVEKFRIDIEKMLQGAFTELGVTKPDSIEIELETPPEGLGDYAFPCFALASVLKKSPNQIAIELFELLPKQQSISFDVKGPYLNFTIVASELVKSVLPIIFKLDDKFGQVVKKDVSIILEHTSANPTDKLHVGRGRNPIIGDTLARILRAGGYEVETQYYVDDMGKQTARKILESRHEGEWDKTKFKTGYQWATSATTVDSVDFVPQLGNELDTIMDEMERGSPDTLKEGEQICTEMMNEIIIPSLDRINIRIDKYVNESQFMFDNSVSEVIDALDNSEHQGVEDGAHYIDLTQFDLKSSKDKFFFIRADGKSLYATRDIAYHLWKFKNCDIAINILGEDHKLESEYVRVGLEIAGSRKFPESMFYAFVNLPEGRMSTRKGTVVYLDDLVDEAYERALVEVKKRREDLTVDEMEVIAEQVGQGAVRYNIIRVQAEKKIVFHWKDALNFEGDSAPFIQYSHARACSILRKAKLDGHNLQLDQFSADLVSDPYEILLVRTLSKLPNLVSECAEKRKPHLLANYAHELAAAFNQFYRECPVIQAESAELIQTRLGLVDATRRVLHNTLNLLGITAPQKM